MGDTTIDFRYLSEADVIAAGVNDMPRCIEVMTEVFGLLGHGDYVMGGKNHNAHGITIHFPKASPFPAMPLDGPDRRFMAMVAYLGGRFRIAGEKWYGSNRANAEKGLPRSILMVCLNDANTGAPLAFLSGNLISAMRTGAIPGVGARYLARKNSETLGLIGAGVISRTCFLSLKAACPDLKTVQIYDTAPSATGRLKVFIEQTYTDMQVIAADSMQAAVRDADIVNIATSGAVYPYLEEQWLKPGIYLSLPASVELPKPFVFRAKKVVDNWEMYEDWMWEYGGMPGGYPANLGSLGAYLKQQTPCRINRSQPSHPTRKPYPRGTSCGGTIFSRYEPAPSCI